MTIKEYEQYMNILKNYNISDGYTIVYDDGSKREVTKQELYDDLYGDIFSTANDNWYSDHSSKNWKRIACFIINGHKVPYDVVQEINNDEFDAKHRFDDEYEESSMKKLNITREQFNRSNYFTKKYGKLEYVSESGKLFKTNKGKVLKFKESRKLVKEGAGAGYTVHIKDLKFGSILEKKYVKMEKDYESYYECQVEIMPGEYEIAAEDYYNDFFWQEHEFGDTPTAKIDGGIATISYSTNSYDEDEAEDELRHEVARRTMDICFDYGHGWVHANLSRDKIEADHVEVENSEFYGSIDKIELNAPDLADAVNCGYQSTFNQGEEDQEDEENVDDLTNESYDDRWMEVGAGFDEFRQRLWNHARKDVKNRKDAFSQCMNKCEEALKEYQDTVMPEEDPHSSTRMF